jgi:Ras family protein T1
MMLGGKSSAGGRTSLRVAVAGDKGTGKSSLISAVASETFPDNVPRVLPPITLPADAFPDYIPITIVDTPSSIDNRIKLIEEFRKADVVLLTYACDQPSTLDRLSSYWLPELRRLEVSYLFIAEISYLRILLQVCFQVIIIYVCNVSRSKHL